jgi:glycosyltransferase involved in cell wall biosynthesis
MLSSVHLPFDTRIFHKEAQTLNAAGYDVTFVVPHERDEIVEGVNVRALPRPKARLWRMLTLPPRILWEAVRLRADIYHFHDPELIPVGVALKVLGRRVIYDAHEHVPKSILAKGYLPRWVRRPLAWLVGLTEQAASRIFDLVIAAEAGILHSFRHHPRTLLIRNYPAHDRFPRATPRGGSNGRFRVAYAGALTTGRGAVEMVEGLGRVPERCQASLVLFGRLRPDDLEARLRKLPGFARMDFRGWMPYDAALVEMAGADAGIVCFLPEPNNVNAGPTKLFEYMACGLPVVASNFPMWREVIEDNDCGLCVDPNDPMAIARALEYLADHPERREEMGRNGRQAVERQYNWQVEADRLLEAYARLIATQAESGQSKPSRN